MSRLLIVLIKVFAASAIVTQIAVAAAYRFSLLPIAGGAFAMLVFVAMFALFSAVFLSAERMPRASFMSEIRKNGFTPKAAAGVQRWVDKCAKRGMKNNACILLAQMLFSCGRYTEGFSSLEKVDYHTLEKRLRPVYYNVCLYGAVLCSDIDTAERIYRSGKMQLISVTNDKLSASIKHTLGCFEYLRGDLFAAERLFMQSLETASGPTACDALFGLSACCLDTGRLAQAKQFAEEASLIADDAESQMKLERTMRLVEQAYRDEIEAKG